MSDAAWSWRRQGPGMTVSMGRVRPGRTRLPSGGPCCRRRRCRCRLPSPSTGPSSPASIGVSGNRPTPPVPVGLQLVGSVEPVVHHPAASPSTDDVLGELPRYPESSQRWGTCESTRNTTTDGSCRSSSTHHLQPPDGPPVTQATSPPYGGSVTIRRQQPTRQPASGQFRGKSCVIVR